MEKIADITGALCIFVFVMGLFYQIGGFEKTSRLIRFVVAVYIISSVLTVFEDYKNVSFLYNISIESNKYDYNTEFYNSILYKTQAELEKIIKTRLDEKNISYNEISVHILEQNGTLFADEIVVVCNDIYNESVYNSIKDIITENTKIVIGE